MIAALVLAGWGWLSPAARVPQTDSVLAAADRVAQAWRRHDFGAVVAGAGAVALHLPGTDPSAPLRPGQAAALLRAFVEGAEEVEVSVVVARSVDLQRAYVELRRVFTVRGAASRRAQTVYVSLRRSGPAYRVTEIRVVP
jgi:hypothetical protein